VDTTTLGIIATALTACIAALSRAFTTSVKYYVDRSTKAKDDSTAALLAAAQSNAALVAKLDEVAKLQIARFEAVAEALRQLTDRIDDVRADKRVSGTYPIRRQ